MEARPGRIAVLLLVCLLLPAMPGRGMELREMLSAAVENDARLKALSGALANTLLGIERARLAPGFQLRLSTGEMRFGYSFHPEDGDPPWLIAAVPTGAMVLGRRTETEVTVEVPLALNFGDGTELAALPRLNIRQPLDKLFGGEKFTEAQDRQNRLAAEKARLEVMSRIQEVERALLTQLSAIGAVERSRRELAFRLKTAQEDLEQAERVKAYAKGSVQQRQLEFAVSRLRRETELSHMRYDQAWQQLEKLVGASVDVLPGTLPEPEMALPPVETAERNPEVFLALLSVEVESARLDEQRLPAKPKFFLGGAVKSEYSEVKDRSLTSVGGALEGVFEDYSFSAGVGSVLETGTVFLSAGLSWSLRDRKIEALNLKERETTLEASRWNLAAARNAFLLEREMLGLQIEELRLRREALAEERALADLRLSEATRWLQQGFSTAREVEALRWEREKLDQEARAIQLDALLVRNRLDALVSLEGEKR